MRSPDDFCGPVNLGIPIEYTMLELAQKIIALTGSRASIKFMPLPSDDPLRRRPDITLAKNYLAWEPRTELAEGLKKTILYFRELSLAMGNDAYATVPAIASVESMLDHD